MQWLEEPGKIISKLQEWGAIAETGCMICPYCSGIMILSKWSESIDGYKWKCNDLIIVKKKKPTKCGKRVTLRSNTFFDHLYSELWQILIFVNLWCYNVTLQNIQIQAEMHIETALSWHSICREVVIDFCLRRKNSIGGENLTIEIDECKYYKRIQGEFHAQWVLGGICRETGDIFMENIERRDTETLITLIKTLIQPGSTIISHCSTTDYDASLQDLLHIEHAVDFKYSNVGAYLVEGHWQHAKALLPENNRQKYLYTGYLAKFLFLQYCNKRNLDCTVEFFKAAGIPYSPYSVADPQECAAIEEDCKPVDLWE